MEVKIKPQIKFPYYYIYAAYFPITENTIFVFDDTIYADNEIPYDIYHHELTHLKRQKKIGAKTWINKYLKDSDFRLKEEIIAYRAQLEYILAETKDWKEYANILAESATNLSSELYGNLISYPEAIKLLRV